MSPEKYVQAAVANIEKKIGTLPYSKGQRPTPMKTGYHPAKDDSPELNAEGLRHYQEVIGILRGAVEIGRLDTLPEVALLSSHLALPWKAPGTSIPYLCIPQAQWQVKGVLGSDMPIDQRGSFCDV
jgi:hypothetical protein